MKKVVTMFLISALSLGVFVPVFAQMPTEIQVVECKITATTLRWGAKGPEVLKLNKILKVAGFYTPTTPTEIFDSKTLIAVYKFQQAKKLPVSGVADGATISTLNRLCSLPQNTATTTTPAGISNTCSSSNRDFTSPTMQFSALKVLGSSLEVNELPAVGYDHEINGDVLYRVGYNHGIQSYKVGTNGSLTHLATFYQGMEQMTRFGAAISNSHLYLADGKNGVKVFNISNPSSPVLATSLSVPGQVIVDVVLDGGFLFMATHDAQLVIAKLNSSNTLSIISPIPPKRQINTSRAPEQNSLAIYNGVAYIASPHATVTGGAYEPGKPYNPITIHDGVRMYKYTNMNTPVYVGNINEFGYPVTIKVHNGYLYVGSGSKAGLWMYSLSNPSSPQYVSTFAPFFNSLVYSIDIVGNVLITLNDTAGMPGMTGTSGAYKEIQFSRLDGPTSPTLITGYDSPDFGSIPFVDGGGVVLGKSLLVSAMDQSNGRLFSLGVPCQVASKKKASTTASKKKIKNSAKKSKLRSQ